MLGNTLYGTLRTWPAIQFSTDAEGWRLWAGYVKRGRAMFACAVGAFILGTQATIHRF